MKRIAATIQVDRSPEDVHAFASDYRMMPEWRGGVSESVPLTDGPVRVGTRIRGGGKVCSGDPSGSSSR
jgi:hypothetical protein